MTSVNLLNHHLIPPDETRYATAAWEMLSRHDLLVPHLNGVSYHHKPPLLFWLYDLGWTLFGVTEFWVLTVSPLCALVGLYLTKHLAGLLWPDNTAAVRLAPWLLFGSLLWGAFLNAAMFDTLLTLCVLLALIGLVEASRDLRAKSWALFAVGCGLGLLAKGPVVFVFTLIPFLTGRYWSNHVNQNAVRWFWQGGLAVIAGILIALCWAIPAILSAGDDYGGTLLWHQTVDRVTHSFAHRRPFWWYAMLSPAILFPWFIWPRTWRSLWNKGLLQDLSFRFCLIWFGGAFIGFSLISGKQVHYLIPLLPALALMMSRAFSEQRGPISIGDFLPYSGIIIFGLVLTVLPLLPGIKLYHWLLHRQLWWALLLIAIGVVGIASMLLIRKPSPYPVSLAVLAALIASLAGFFGSTGNAFDLRKTAEILANYRQSGEPAAWAGTYDGQFQFVMRLTEPMTVIEKHEILSWLSAHPNGHVVTVEKSDTVPPETFNAKFVQYYRENKLWLLSMK